MTAPATSYLRQGDPRWRAVRLGEGNLTIGKAGCLLCCVAEAASRQGTSTHRDPRPLNDAGVIVGAFVGSGAIIDRLAHAVGLVCGPRMTGSPAELLTAINEAVIAGACVLMHVDHDSKRVGGDYGADHWVLAIHVGENGITYIDPATGEDGAFPRGEIVTQSTWGDRRVFGIRAIRVLSAA